MRMHDSLKEAISKHWRLLVAHGAIITLLGLLAIAAPMVATLAVELFIGWLFLISGIVGLIAVFSMRDISAFVWSLITAALSTFIGVLMVWHPAAGAFSLTIVLTAFFFAEGIFQTAAALGYRHVLAGSWGFMLLSGITDIALALIIVFGLPMSATWTLGILVGINLITSGYAILTIAFVGRRMAKELGAA
jgi:uncharacterized membrane protein HdeD (DUF308 family)